MNINPYEPPTPSSKQDKRPAEARPDPPSAHLWRRVLLISFGFMMMVLGMLVGGTTFMPSSWLAISSYAVGYSLFVLGAAIVVYAIRVPS